MAASQVDAVFPIIAPPMSLAAESLAGPTTALRRTATSSSSSSSSLTPRPPAAAAPALSRTLLHEDVFARLLSGPLLVVHFALYGAVPLYYLALHSPFSGARMPLVVRCGLAVAVQYLTAALVVSWFGAYPLRRDVTAVVYMAVGACLLTGAKALVEDAASARAVRLLLG